MSMLFCDCKKETKAQIVTVRDTVYVEVRDTTVIPALISDTTTTLIVLRHAEKETTGADPNLNSDGLLRAEELKRLLDNLSISAIYSTPFNRTRQTVQPLATAKGLSITEYPTTKSYTDLESEILSAYRGKIVVVVGHSNTVPDMVKELSNNSFNVIIEDSQYDNLFVVSMPEKLKPTVTPLKYGKETP
ncbi:SixA phosphatase family protein [Polluticoccus soli]|uniref:SixA phosphatase family protein n=1 Tax=Polluticoccus soli TaxID=3034150 RepID=UPI0023E2CE55|nr:phosphoglycerate mutase family protein [Flavipsychrobacter sp. JY13-12]